METLELTSVLEEEIDVSPSGKIYKRDALGIEQFEPHQLHYYKLGVDINPTTLHVSQSIQVELNKKRHSVARLIATRFVANPNGYSQLKWVNGDFTNNAAGNLEWVPDATLTTRDVSATFLREVDVDTLGKWNKIVYRFIKTDDEQELEQLCYEGDFQRYLYEALYHHGVTAKDVPRHMRRGYELFKRKLRHYYFPFAGKAGEDKLRKYCYICFLAPACHRLNVPFSPRLRTQKVTTPEVFDYL